jgi:hypothetical protein
MPCYRCGVRQTDPGRGPSPWKRGVRRDSQVLICPGCQADTDWTADLDRCARCSSVHLVRRLGEVECRDCGMVAPPGDDAADDGLPGAGLSGAGLPGAGLAGGDLAGADASGALAAGPGPVAHTGTSHLPDLSEEVARALERVLRQGLVGQSGLVTRTTHRTASSDPR